MLQSEIFALSHLAAAARVLAVTQTGHTCTCPKVIALPFFYEKCFLKSSQADSFASLKTL